MNLLICGDGPDFIELKRLIVRLELSSRIILYGDTLPDDLVKLYQQSDCLVSASLVETFGVVLIDAMACGLTVIATKCGGPEDIINEDIGILVEAGSVSEMAKALYFVFENKMIFDSSKIVKFAERYSPSVVAKEIIRFYQ